MVRISALTAQQLEALQQRKQEVAKLRILSRRLARLAPPDMTLPGRYAKKWPAEPGYDPRIDHVGTWWVPCDGEEP